MLRDLVRQEWEYYRERPFGRLVRLFVERFFRGGGDTDAEGIDLGVGLVLTLLAIPGGFVSILLFNKYGSLLQWLRGIKHVDVLQIAFSDEYFFIVLSMAVTGAVAVWRWDAIFPDRRDYANLVHLPISTRTILLANLVAVVFLVGLLAIDLNAASCVLFPTVVTAAQTQFLFFLKFAVVHALGVVAASVFTFFAIFALLGILMAMFSPPALKRASAFARGMIIVYLLALLCTSFAVPNLLQQLRGAAPGWTFLVPSCWFVSLCQWIRGRATPTMVELAKLSLPAIVAVGGIGLCAYAIGYRRHFVRIAEIADTAVISHRSLPWRVRAWERFLLRTPFQKGCSQFVVKTMVRSEAHRLVLTGVGVLGLVLASQALMAAFEEVRSVREAALTADALSIPFILTFLIVLGLRIVFEIPSDLRANWIFQLTLDAEHQECEPLARKVMLAAVLPWALGITFPVYVYLEGWSVASLHTLLVILWAVLLINVCLIRFRKTPFTCSIPAFKQHSIVILISFCFGYLIYVGSTAEFESAALAQPLRILGALPVALIAWYVPRYLGKNTISLERRLIFEEGAVRTVERLGLSE